MASMPERDDFSVTTKKPHLQEDADYSVKTSVNFHEDGSLYNAVRRYNIVLDDESSNYPMAYTKGSIWDITGLTSREPDADLDDRQFPLKSVDPDAIRKQATRSVDKAMDSEPDFSEVDAVVGPSGGDSPTREERIQRRTDDLLQRSIEDGCVEWFLQNPPLDFEWK